MKAFARLPIVKRHGGSLLKAILIPLNPWRADGPSVKQISSPNARAAEMGEFCVTADLHRPKNSVFGSPLDPRLHDCGLPAVEMQAEVAEALAKMRCTSAIYACLRRRVFAESEAGGVTSGMLDDGVQRFVRKH